MYMLGEGEENYLYISLCNKKNHFIQKQKNLRAG